MLISDAFLQRYPITFYSWKSAGSPLQVGSRMNIAQARNLSKKGAFFFLLVELFFVQSNAFAVTIKIIGEL